MYQWNTVIQLFSCLFQEGSKADIFDWLKEVVVQNLYNTHDYNGLPLDDEDASKFISDYYAIRLGPPRLRMLRVKPSNKLCLRFTAHSTSKFHVH